MQILEVKKEDLILVVAPHPDDECIGAGGVLALYPKQCEVIVLTDGRQGQGEVLPIVEKEIRKKEFLEEMKIAGIDRYRMLEYEDGTLLQHTDCLFSIDLSAYTKIFVTGIYDNHADHTAACMSVIAALKKQKIRNKEVYIYEVHTPLREITHALNITDVLEKKLSLIRIHQSQLHNLKYDRMARNLAEYRGIQNRMKDCCLEAYYSMSIYDDLSSPTIELENQLQKSTLFYWVLTRWLKLKLSGIRLADILQKYDYKKIAVYGYAEIGQLLCQELLQDGFKVSYVMDKKVCETKSKRLPVYQPGAGLPEVDAVIVTAVYYFDDIRNDLLKMGFHNVISFRTLIEG